MVQQRGRGVDRSRSSGARSIPSASTGTGLTGGAFALAKAALFDMKKDQQSWRLPYAVLMVSAVFCSTLPKENWIPLTVCLGCFGYLGVLWILNGAKVTRSTPTLGAAVLFVSVVASLPMAIWNGVSLRDWLFRGSAPLLFMFVYFILPLRSNSDIQFVRKTLIMCCFVWAGKIIWSVNLAEVMAVRWTTMNRDLFLPYNLVAVSSFLLEPERYRLAVRVPGILLFVVLTVGGGFRTQLVLLFVLISVSLLNPRKRFSLTPLLATVVLAGAAYLYTSTGGGQSALVRFLDLPREVNSSRAKEIEFAAERFLESPIFGKGLGYPIPVNVTFYGREGYLYGIRGGNTEYEYVTYLHNSVMFVLMTLGLLGLTGMSLFIGGALLYKREHAALLVGNARRACWWGLVTVLASTLTAATINLFQFNLLVGSLAALLATPAHRYGGIALEWPVPPADDRREDASAPL